jgi:hypothetical protein
MACWASDVELMVCSMVMLGDGMEMGYVHELRLPGKCHK